MKKLMILLVVALCFSLAVQASTTTKKTTVLFNTAKHDLTNKAVKELKEFLKNNHTKLDYEVTIEGHTDSRGNIAYNKNLSYNRAEEVKQFLMKNGIDEKLISFQFKGELDPEKPNVNDENMTVNRRVEVTITTYQFDNIKELEEALSPKKTSYHILQPDKEAIVKGSKGVRVLIKPNTFTYNDGSPCTEEIRFELTESLSYQDYIASGLLTKSSNQLLESGGMIKIAAKTVSGKPVVADKDNPMTIAIPTENRQDDMEVFASTEGSNWQARNQPITKKVVYRNRKFPQMKKNAVSLPKFKLDKSGKPEHPVAPKVAKVPYAPRVESYKRPIPWYKINKKKLRKRQDNSYEKAVVYYDKRTESYDRKLKIYQAKMEVYNTEMKQYEREMKKWHKKQLTQQDEFKKTSEYQEAQKAYEACYQKNLADYKAAVAEWKENHKNFMAQRGDDLDKLGVTTKNDMNNYVFAFNELSWINVDRFYHMSQKEKQTIVMTTEKVGDERVLIMFNNINSMLSMSPDENDRTYTQQNFPKKEPAVIFAYKVEKGKPMLCYQVIDGAKKYKLKYELTSFAEIKAILGQFDKS